MSAGVPKTGSTSCVPFVSKDRELLIIRGLLFFRDECLHGQIMPVLAVAARPRFQTFRTFQADAGMRRVIDPVHFGGGDIEESGLEDAAPVERVTAAEGEGVGFVGLQQMGDIDVELFVVVPAPWSREVK